jgi:hypothetical protein
MASIMGESGDIFFPKLDEERDMIPFDRIALDLLKYLGMEADICESEEEAKRKMVLRQAQQPGKAQQPGETYPVYFFSSDTSGEKPYEEFFTEKEDLDNDSFINLGVIKNSVKRNSEEIDEIFNKLHNLFESDNVTKGAIVDILKTYLPNFEHIETGKGLDSKM